MSGRMAVEDDILGESPYKDWIKFTICSVKYSSSSSSMAVEGNSFSCDMKPVLLSTLILSGRFYIRRNTFQSQWLSVTKALGIFFLPHYRNSSRKMSSVGLKLIIAAGAAAGVQGVAGKELEFLMKRRAIGDIKATNPKWDNLRKWHNNQQCNIWIITAEKLIITFWTWWIDDCDSLEEMNNPPIFLESCT